MKFLFVIDSLGSGGAQKQLFLLAKGMLCRGHSVELFNYFPQINFFRNEFVEAGIKIFDYPKKPGLDFGVIGGLRALLKKKRYDVALSFLDTPNLLLTFASLGLKVTVVLSERSSFAGGNQYIHLLKKQFYRFAKAVTVNSLTQANWLINFCKLPENLISIFRNGYDLDKQKYSPFPFENSRDLKLLGIGRVSPAKNIECLIAGLELFFRKHGWMPSLSWAGKTDNNDYAERIFRLIDKHFFIRSKWFWLGEQKDVLSLLSNHNALILPSRFEGLPNAVCEAMFAGKPILCSDVCDNSFLIKNGINGFLFSPDSPEQLAESIEKLTLLRPFQQLQISIANRIFAEQNLALETMVDAYESLFISLKEEA